uniref:Cytochrome c biogenesis protein CcdA n=1 Tax=Roseihalotalea indica TaxID=2867963 RepID=A0AA49GUA6_9BACT|nr:cytochrome c biogenesis protein CcdA [Tunicatimonas sp. TK19036]
MQTRYVPFLLTLFLFTIAGKLPLQAQILKPATWQVAWSEEKAAVGEEIDLVFTVTIDPDWYLYSSDFDPDLGPMVTEFTFEPAEGYELVGDIKPIGAKEKYDELWEGTYTYFTGKAEFRQTVKVLNEKPNKISGSYSYQVCTDVDGRCIPFDDEFALSIPLGGKASSPTEGSDESTSTSTPTITNDFNQRESTTPYTLITFFFISFLAGLAALLTPCVFPMIPMTVTFFTNDSKSGGAIRKAVIYGLSIIAIYTIVGTLVSVIFGPTFANWLSTHWLPNLFFFAVFIFFALSFLGLFEITLPSSLVNKVDQEADKGGYYGIFFMAFTLVLVSFSCTGPIVGSVLVESAGGQFAKPIVGMLGFSLAFAIPFALFAAFPQWLSSLPKSGGWLNSVKVVLGFLELALALKFLSVADQVYHWNILDREVYLALWIVIFALIGFYLLGKIRLPHDSPLESVSVPRLMLSVVTFAFVVYLIPGLFGAPLKALAGYLPPMHTHDFNMPMLIAQQQVSNSGTLLTSNEEALCEEPKHSELLHFPHGIQGYFDYDQALACAQAQNKPIFIDFTGHGCVNCREMEARVWSDPAVLQRLKKDFVVVALYVDEKTELPESDWYTSEYDGKVKKSIGKQNADLQIRRFNNNAQPYYVLLNEQGELLAKPKAYDLSVPNFVEFLELGKKRFAAGETVEDPALARK